MKYGISFNLHNQFKKKKKNNLAYQFGTPRGMIWMGIWRTLHPQRILHEPGAISVHDIFR